MLERYLSSGLYHEALHGEVVRAFQAAWDYKMPNLS
jgi:hypothetical protein